MIGKIIPQPAIAPTGRQLLNVLKALKLVRPASGGIRPEAIALVQPVPVLGLAPVLLLARSVTTTMARAAGSV